MLGEMSELKTYVIIALSAVLFLLAMCILDAFSQKTSLVDSGITSRSELTRADRLFDPLSGLRSVNDVDLKKERELVLRSQFEKFQIAYSEEHAFMRQDGDLARKFL